MSYRNSLHSIRKGAGCTDAKAIPRATLTTKKGQKGRNTIEVRSAIAESIEPISMTLFSEYPVRIAPTINREISAATPIMPTSTPTSRLNAIF